MYKSVLSLCAGFILMIAGSTQLQAQDFKYYSLLQNYTKMGDLNKIEVLMNASQQNFSVKELVSRLNNSTALTISERSVYQDMLKDISLRKAAEFFNAKTKLSSVQGPTSEQNTMAKSTLSGQFLLTEYEYFIDFGGGGWHTLDKYSYDNNLNTIQWVNQNYDSTAGWVNSSLMVYSYDGFNRDTLEVNQGWDLGTLSWVNYGKWSTDYDASNNPLNTLYSYWADPEWVLSGRTSYTYDANNNTLERLSQMLVNSDWVNDSRETYTYDANNNLLTDIYDTWNGTAWQEFTKTENTYDANNNLISYTFSFFGNYSNKDIHTYDSNNNQISDSNYSWNSTSSSWVINFVQTSTYDAMNNQIHYLIKQSNGSYLEDYLQYDAAFNAFNKITSWRSYTMNRGHWVPRRKAEYSYDADQNNTLVTDSSSSDGGLTWKLFLFERMTWSPAVTGVDNNNNNTLPLAYRLSQNFPNPFNPTTTIKYSIPKLSFVTLKVYDVLGNEISTLANEEKPAGSYEVHVNASGLSSGIYFYKLQAGGFVDTKKLILMK